MSAQAFSARLGADGSPAIAFGGDYNPEQWDRATWVEDIELMKVAGVNLVSIGIFSWGLLEPEEGMYEFGWLDDIVELLHAGGIRIDMANASASPPAWFSAKYPQSLPVTADGVRLEFGSRQMFCGSSADYRRAAAAMTTQIVQRYADHPGVVMWHVHNEYGCHNQPCYCDASAAAFRGWLERKYSSIEVLNDAWGTAFWSQNYARFDDIRPPRRSGTFVNPTQQLDFARFSSDELLECFKAEAAIIREHSAKPVTTNFMGFSMGLERPIDYWKWADEMDVISNDHYLIAEDPRNFQDLAMAADFMRGLSVGEPWLLMEHSTSAVNWQPRNIAKQPGEMLRNSLQHVARGADGALFFQWRAAKAGAEKFHSAMLPHGGTDTRVWREVVELGAALGALAEVVGSQVAGIECAIIHDTDARWAGELDVHPSIDLDVMGETRLWHDALYRAGVNSDFRRSTDDLSGYRLVVVPLQYLMTDAGADNIRRFAESGGTVVVTYFSGIVDEKDHIRLGGYPGAFRDMLGVTMEEFYPLRAGEELPLSAFGPGTIFSELGTTTGAEALAVAIGGQVSGSPIVTKHGFGSGNAFYVATRLGTRGLDELVGTVLSTSGIDRGGVLPAVGQDVELVWRERDGKRWAFVINHSDLPVSVELSGHELLSNRSVSAPLIVDAGAAVVVRVHQNSADEPDQPRSA